jgi:hypothetical protein
MPETLLPSRAASSRVDIAGIVAGFPPDAIARFGDFPEMRGRDAVEAFIRARFARQKNYRLQKHPRWGAPNVVIAQELAKVTTFGLLAPRWLTNASVAFLLTSSQRTAAEYRPIRQNQSWSGS